MGNSNSGEGAQIRKLGDNFWHVRAQFKIFKFFNIGTHMSIVQRQSSGKFLIIDTVPLDENLKRQIDDLTNHGEDIEAVIATHPFHTLAFPEFYEAYPRAEYYGTPRHRRSQPKIPWKAIEDNLMSFAPDIEMRIPAGAEFVSPQPEAYNHFNSVWVFVPRSRMLHVDDTIGYSEEGGFLKNLIVKPKVFHFHFSLKGPALLPTSDAPQLFQNWLLALLSEWDFDSVCTAHNGNCMSGAKQLLRQALEDAKPTFDKLTEERSNKPASMECVRELNCPDLNVEGDECG